VAWFYEIRSSTNAVLKRDDGFATQDAAKIARTDSAGSGSRLIIEFIGLDG